MNTIEKLIEVKNLEYKLGQDKQEIFEEILDDTKNGTLTWERTVTTSVTEVFETTNLGEYTWAYTVKREGYVNNGSSLVLWQNTKEEARKALVSGLRPWNADLGKLEEAITTRLVAEGRANLVRMLKTSEYEYVKDCVKSFYNKSLEVNGYNAYFLDVPKVMEARTDEYPKGLWRWSCRIECNLRDNSDCIIPKAKPGEIACAIYKFLELKGINIRNWETTKSDRLRLDLYASNEEREEQ